MPQKKPKNLTKVEQAHRLLHYDYKKPSQKKPLEPEKSKISTQSNNKK